MLTGEITAWKVSWETTVKGKTRREHAFYTTREAAQHVADELVASGKVDYQPEIEQSQL